MDKNAQLQTADQTLKGAVIALIMYVMNKYDVDTGLIYVTVPVAAGVMAALSTRFGNKNTACMFMAKNKENG